MHFQDMHQEPKGKMNEIDAVRLNFKPESLVALNFILAFVMFGVALDMKPEDFRGITAAPRAVLIACWRSSCCCRRRPGRSPWHSGRSRASRWG